MKVFPWVCGYFFAAAAIDASVSRSRVAACVVRPRAFATRSSELCHEVPHAAPG